MLKQGSVNRDIKVIESWNLQHWQCCKKSLCGDSSETYSTDSVAKKVCVETVLKLTAPTVLQKKSLWRQFWNLQHRQCCKKSLCGDSSETYSTDSVAKKVFVETVLKLTALTVLQKKSLWRQFWNLQHRQCCKKSLCGDSSETYSTDSVAKKVFVETVLKLTAPTVLQKKSLWRQFWNLQHRQCCKKSLCGDSSETYSTDSVAKKVFVETVLKLTAPTVLQKKSLWRQFWNLQHWQCCNKCL